MTTSITKQFKFEAAHSLPKHDGKCKNLHGHSYVFQVTVSGEVQTEGPKTGMVIDLNDLSDIVDKHIIKLWDHTNLNDILPFETTAENLAAEIFKIVEKLGLNVAKVKLSETATGFAEVVK